MSKSRDMLGKLEKPITIVVGFIAMSLFFGGLANCYLQLSSKGVYRKEYEGRLIDKSATFRETDTNPVIAKRLVIENQNGERFAVAVDKEIYDRAQVGMWIKKDGQGVIITSKQ